jgi:hypothetical protein
MKTYHYCMEYNGVKQDGWLMTDRPVVGAEGYDMLRRSVANIYELPNDKSWVLVSLSIIGVALLGDVPAATSPDTKLGEENG